MANRSYLCSSPLNTIYPSFVQADYDSDEQTIACDVYCIPILWMCLFRPEDMVTQSFTVDGETVPGRAPVADRTRALAALARARPVIVQLFRQRGDLGPYFDLFRQAVEASPFEFLSIELEEIACLHEDEGAFYESFLTALSEIEAPSRKQASRLLGIAAVRGKRPFPSARLLLDQLESHDDDFWNHCRVMGAGRIEAGLGRPVPWEK